MPRLMSVSHTEQQVIDRTKTVTRRKGWYRDRNDRLILHVGDRLTLCRKVMGRRRPDGTVEPLVRLADVEVVDIARMQLRVHYEGDAAREGFPDWTWEQFVEFFCSTFGGDRDQVVTRIEFRYLDAGSKVKDLMAELQASVDRAKASRPAERAR
jgi:hypothetical protein